MKHPNHFHLQEPVYLGERKQLPYLARSSCLHIVENKPTLCTMHPCSLNHSVYTGTKLTQYVSKHNHMNLEEEFISVFGNATMVLHCRSKLPCIAVRALSLFPCLSGHSKKVLIACTRRTDSSGYYLRYNPKQW